MFLFTFFIKKIISFLFTFDGFLCWKSNQNIWKIGRLVNLNFKDLTLTWIFVNQNYDTALQLCNKFCVTRNGGGRGAGAQSHNQVITLFSNSLLKSREYWYKHTRLHVISFWWKYMALWKRCLKWLVYSIKW